MVHSPQPGGLLPRQRGAVGHPVVLLIEDSKHCSPHSKQKLLLNGQEGLGQGICVYFSWYRMEGGFVQSHCISVTNNSIH